MDEEKPIIDITSEPYRRAEPSSGQYAAAQSSMDHLLRRRRWSFVLILAFVCACGVIWAWMQPRLFRATGTILISRLGRVASPVTAAELASEVEILKSQAGEITAGAGGSTRVAESMQATAARRQKLKTRVEVGVVDKSQVIQVSFVDGSRKASSDAVNMLMDLYLQHRYRMYAAPIQIVSAESEGQSLQAKADLAMLELQQLDRSRNAAIARNEHEVQSRRRISVEERVLETRSLIRGQEEVLRVMRSRSSDNLETVQEEARLAGLKAQLAELEKALAPISKADVSSGTLAMQREELKERAQRAQDQANRIARRLQDARLGSAGLEARILTRAEPVALESWDQPWWVLLLFGVGALLLASLGTWIVDMMDRPVYDDDDFSNLTGTPPMKGRARAAGA